MKLCLKVLTKLIHIVLFQKQASGLQTLWLAWSCMEAPVWVFQEAGNWSLFKAKVLKSTKMRKYVLYIFAPLFGHLVLYLDF